MTAPRSACAFALRGMDARWSRKHDGSSRMQSKILPRTGTCSTHCVSSVGSSVRSIFLRAIRRPKRRGTPSSLGRRRIGVRLKIVLDTDVASAFAQPRIDPVVEAWGESLRGNEFFITSTTLSELVFGVMIMPEGRRKSELDDRVARFVSGFYDRTIPFDANAAIEYGRFTADRRSAGRPIQRADGQIAACCLASGATLATRNVKDFVSIPGLKITNPWDHRS